MIDVPFRGTLAHAEHIADLSVTESIERKKVEHLLRHRRQAAEQAFQMLHVEALFGLIPVDHFVVFAFDRISKNGQFAPFLFLPEFVDGCIDHDPPYPGLERHFVAPIAVEVLYNFQKTVVERRYCLLFVTSIAHTHSHQYRETHAVQGVLRLTVALVGGSEQLRVNVHAFEGWRVQDYVFMQLISRQNELTLGVGYLTMITNHLV